MNTQIGRQSLLRQIAQIQQMERGKLCVMRQGSGGPFYNLLCRQDGKTVSRYVPREQAQAVAENTAHYAHFEQLVQDYARLVSEQTRAEREAGVKKKTQPLKSSWPRTKRSRK